MSCTHTTDDICGYCGSINVLCEYIPYEWQTFKPEPDQINLFFVYPKMMTPRFVDYDGYSSARDKIKTLTKLYDNVQYVLYYALISVVITPPQYTYRCVPLGDIKKTISHADQSKDIISKGPEPGKEHNAN